MAGFLPQLPVTTSKGTEAVGRLFAAAVVDAGFRSLLLDNPAAALARGYNGETFHLPVEDHEFFITIQAKNLTDFARQWVDYQGTRQRCGEISWELTRSPWTTSKRDSLGSKDGISLNLPLASDAFQVAEPL